MFVLAHEISNIKQIQDRSEFESVFKFETRVQYETSPIHLSSSRIVFDLARLAFQEVVKMEEIKCKLELYLLTIYVTFYFYLFQPKKCMSVKCHHGSYDMCVFLQV